MISSECWKIRTTNSFSRKSLLFWAFSKCLIRISQLRKILWYKFTTMISFEYFIDIFVTWRFDIFFCFSTKNKVECLLYFFSIMKTIAIFVFAELNSMRFLDLFKNTIRNSTITKTRNLNVIKRRKTTTTMLELKKRKSKRMIQKKFYSYIIQIRRFLHFSHRNTFFISINFFLS